MPCYQCSRCNKCGMLSVRTSLTCSNCGEPIRPGVDSCPSCKTPYAGNMTRGKMGRLDEETGIITEFDPLAGQAE